MDKINQRFGTQFKAEDQVHTLRQITAHVAHHDPRLLDLLREGNDGMWKMLYDNGFAPGFMEVALSNASFFETFSTQEKLDYLREVMREPVRQFLLREMRRTNDLSIKYELCITYHFSKYQISLQNYRRPHRWEPLYLSCRMCKNIFLRHASPEQS